MFESFMMPQSFIPGSQIMRHIRLDDIGFILYKLFGGKVEIDSNPRACEDLFYIQNHDVGKLIIHTEYRSDQQLRNFLIDACIQYYNVMKYYSRDKITIRHVYVSSRKIYGKSFNIGNIIGR